MKQLNVFEEIKRQTEIDVSLEKPYRNGLGELLPWEEPEYLKTHVAQFFRHTLPIAQTIKGV